MERKKASDFPQGLLNLFDQYVHGAISRRAFLDGAQNFAVGGVTASALFEMLKPNYAWALQVPERDSRIATETATVPSPHCNGRIDGYLVRPSNPAAKLPVVVVIHENRGLNPYIKDVARRLAVAGFIAFAPEALTSVGGNPNDDEKAAQLFQGLDRAKLTEDFLAAAFCMRCIAALRGLAEQAAHRRGPISQFARALICGHARFEAALHAPMVHKSVRLGKEAGVQPGEICRAKRSRFFDLRTIDRIAENIGEPLHGPIRNCHAAVDAQRVQHACAFLPIVLHRGEQISSLVTHAFERGSRQFARPSRARQAKQGAAHIRPPMRGPQPDACASAPLCSAVVMIFRLSRSHWTAAPAMKTEPSSA